MISGLVSFSTIVESVKDETGIENMRSYYDRMRRLIFRAEREIGYGGSVVLKKIIFEKDVNFNGKYIKFPIDFIEFEGVGNCCKPFRNTEYRATSDGVRMRESQNKVVLLYWGVVCDGEGNPITTRNHEEAVIAYCIWKLYSPKVFLGVGNANLRNDYEFKFNSLCLEARGDDAFPTLEEWTGIGLTSYTDRRPLLMYETAGYNYCDDTIQTACVIIDETNNNNMVYFGQFSNLNGTLNEVLEALELDSEGYLQTLDNDVLFAFQQGKIINYSNVGKIIFVVTGTTNPNWQIVDALGNDVTHMFESEFNFSTQTYVFVSIQEYTYSSIYFKFKEL